MDFRQSHTTPKEKDQLLEVIQDRHNGLKFDHPLHLASVNVVPTGSFVHGDIPHVTVRYYHKNPDNTNPESAGNLLATSHINVKVCEFIYLFWLEIKLLF
jgi:hypothetical protein